jgi:prepilin-type N-terminal cleavage/methylation domain-containing protein
MKEPKYTKQGFTLTEILIVVGLITMIGIIVPIFNSNTLHKESFEAEIEKITDLLFKARHNSQNNINQSKHGVFIQNEGYTLFEGNSFALSEPQNNIFIKSEYPIQIATTSIVEIIFNESSAEVTNKGEIMVTDKFTNKVVSIKINHEGQIDY